MIIKILISRGLRIYSLMEMVKEYAY